MYIFNIILKNGHVLVTTHHDGEDATSVSEKLQSWLGVKGSLDAKRLQESVSIKDFKGDYIMFKVDELVGVKITKQDDKEYALANGIQPKQLLHS